MSGQTIKAHHILVACANKYDWRANTIIPEWTIDGGRADLLVVSKAGYATEIEIKISRSDWNADQHKGKFSGERPQVARFFYAGPVNLMEAPPPWLADDVGLIGVYLNRYGDPLARIIRPAARRKAQKIGTAAFYTDVRAACYYRFWTLNARMLRGGNIVERGEFNV